MEWRNQKQIERNTKRYTDQHEALRFLLGGIGTGNISIDTAGRFCDFEIFGHPDKGLKLPDAFFAMWSQVEGEPSDARILEVAQKGPCNRALGVPSAELSNLPRFDSSVFSSHYPFAEIELKKDGFPFKVEMEAFTPFIPLNSDDSGMPAFRISYKVTNLSDKPASVSICGTMPNVGGYQNYDNFERMILEGEHRNTFVQADGLTGLTFDVDGLADDHLTRGGLTIATDGTNVTAKPQWMFTGWWDGAEDFWQDFRADGELTPVGEVASVGSHVFSAKPHWCLVGSVANKKEIAPGACAEFNFYISWYFPNRYGWWPDGHQIMYTRPENVATVWQTYYSAIWKDSWAVCADFHNRLEKLTGLSRNFADALYSTTLDEDVIESLVSAITVMRSPTCFRIADGTFYGWEGCFDKEGSCPGTCTHVWNYAQAIAFLFPALERDMRRTEFLVETDDTGNMAFRAQTKLNGVRQEMLPATDGQLGSIMRVYREWKLSGDDDFLKELWQKVKLSMEFSLKTWDSNGDFVLDSQQHNTYDIEFYGINSLTNSILFGALAACAEMAEYLGEQELSDLWRKGLKAGSEKTDAMLWNGEYFIQDLCGEDLNKYRYQYGTGCLSDQLLGQQLAHLYGLGYILPQEHVRSAATSIYKYNFRTSLHEHHSVQRGYAYQDEGGLLLCSWPEGNRPTHPFVYSDEIWSGIEYQVAVNLIYEGHIDEALDIVKMIRSRQNGLRRSPYNEVECGHHYARSMAAWGLLVALSGYQYDLGKNHIAFAPRVNADEFSCFYSNGNEWGVYVQKEAAGQCQKEIIPLYKKD